MNELNRNIDEAPDDTPLLVKVRAVEGTKLRVHTAIKGSNGILIIGNHFAFDMPPVIGWTLAPEFKDYE